MGTFRPRYLLLLSATAFFLLAYIEDLLPAGQLFTFASVAVMLFAHLELNHRRVDVPRSFYIGYLLLFWFFSIASLLWAEKTSLTFIVVRGHFFILLLMTAAYISLSKGVETVSLVRVIMYGSYLAVIYVLLRYGFSEVFRAVTTNHRLSDAVMNANTLGMCAAYAGVIHFHFILQRGRLRPMDLLLIPAAVAIAASGSRKALVIAVGGVFAVYLLRMSHQKDFLKKLFKLILGIGILVVIFILLSRNPIFTRVIQRMNKLVNKVFNKVSGAQKDDIRFIYNQIGWQLFRQHPLLGIGLHNASRYIARYYGHPHLHNNIVELLACGGIVGFLVYYSIYFYLLWEFWRHRRQRDADYDICLLLLLIRLVMGYGHIQYRSLDTYFYLLVFWVETRALRAGRMPSLQSTLGDVWGIAPGRKKRHGRRR